MRARAPAPLTLIALVLGGCEAALGDYEALDAQVVRTLPPSLARYHDAPRGDARLLRVTLRSRLDLNAVEPGQGILVAGDHCPIADGYRLVTYPPTTDAGRIAADWTRDHRPRPAPDGQYRYHLYVAVRAPARPPYPGAAEQIAAYDLSRDRRSICLRLYRPDSTPAPARSAEIEVPAAMLARAFARTD